MRDADLTNFFLAVNQEDGQVIDLYDIVQQELA